MAGNINAAQLHQYMTKVFRLTGFNPEDCTFSADVAEKMTDEVRRLDLIKDSEALYQRDVKPVLTMKFEDPDFISRTKKALRLCRQLSQIAAWYEQVLAILDPEGDEEATLLKEISRDGYLMTLRLHHFEEYLRQTKNELFPAVNQLHVAYLKHSVRADQSLIRSALVREQFKARYNREKREKVLLETVKASGSNVLRFKRYFGTPEKPFYMVTPYPAVVPDFPENTPELPDTYSKLVRAKLEDLEMDADGVLNWKLGIKDENGKELREQWQPDIHSGILLKGMPEGDPPGSWKVFKVQDLADPLPEEMKKYYRNLMLRYFGKTEDG